MAERPAPSTQQQLVGGLYDFIHLFATRRDEVAKDVNRINERERDAGKTERLLVKRIKRGRQSRTDERDRKSGGDDYHRNAAGKLSALHQ